MKTKGFAEWIKNEFGYWVGLFSGVLGIIEVFFNTPLWFKISFCTAALIFIGLFLYKLYFFIEHSKPTEEVEQKYQKQLEQAVERFSMLFVNASENIQKYCQSIVENMCEIENPKTGEEYLQLSYNNICNNIERVFHSLWPKYTVSVCIKKFDLSHKEIYEKVERYKEWELITLARSGGTNIDRANLNKKVTIGENSDFEVIISPNFDASYFACQDLSDIKSEFLKKFEMPYKNSTKDFLNSYKSTIVVPIRLLEKKKRQKNGTACLNSFSLFGFLCVDTKEVYNDSEEAFNIAINYLRAFSDILYKFFDNVYKIKVLELEVEGNDNE